MKGTRRILLVVMVTIMSAIETVHAQELQSVVVGVAKYGGKKLYGVFKSLTSEFDRYYPIDEKTILLPTCECEGPTGPRITYNFDHQSWVTRESPGPIWVRLTVEGNIDDDLKRLVRVVMKGDKGGKADQYRSDNDHPLGDGSVFALDWRNGDDRAYYFVARGMRPGDLPKGVFLRLERK